MSIKNACAFISKYLLFFVFLFCIGCKKTDNKENGPTNIQYGKITIEGHEYSTVTIGSQVWMNENYTGSGGMVYEFSGPPDKGGMYSLFQARILQPPPGWKLPTIADFNILTGNISKTKDANGNYISGPNVESDFYKIHFSYITTGYFMYQTAVAAVNDASSAYFVTADVPPATKNGNEYNMYAYRISPSGAGIVTLDKLYYIALASVRFVKE
ncbi:MAG TPA: FISUMP domain-containing protein [Mucilaginibacter sp.]